MKFRTLILAALLVPQTLFSADLKGKWEMDKCELTYVVVHPLHTVHGKSLSARGKGVCYGRDCDFLVAVPVKSFDSGDQNRDFHMLQTVRAGTFPMVQVHVKVADGRGAGSPQIIKVVAAVEFAGKKHVYRDVPLDVLEWKSGTIHLRGTLPLTLKDFEIPAPSLLTVPIHNEIPVKMDMFWKRSGVVEPSKK
jgi:hypothetical protein